MHAGCGYITLKHTASIRTGYYKQLLVYQLITKPIPNAVLAAAKFSSNVLQFILHGHLSLHYFHPSGPSIQTLV
jgi:hypothetical protein